MGIQQRGQTGQRLLTRVAEVRGEVGWDMLAAQIARATRVAHFDFSSNLAQAVERGRQSQSMSMATTSSRHLPGEARAVGDAELMYRTPNQSSIDGNTVEMDVERVNFADNAMRYEANLTILGSKIKSLLSAVQ